MINYRFAAKSNNCKGIFTAVMLSVLISACSSSGSDDNTSSLIGPGVTENPRPNVPVITDPVNPVNTDPVNPVNTDPVNPVNTDPVNVPTQQNISSLINTPGVDGWVCALGDGTFGAYLFYADLTGRFDYLTDNGDNTFAIDSIDEFTYVTTSANSVEILYEFPDGTSLTEAITNIAFAADVSGFTAQSDVEGALTCGRSQLTTVEPESGNSTIPYGVYF